MTAPAPLPPLGTRVLLDCDGGTVLCEVIAHDDLRGMVRMRMILPGQPRDGLTFWRPADSPVIAVQEALL